MNNIGERINTEEEGMNIEGQRMSIEGEQRQENIINTLIIRPMNFMFIIISVFFLLLVMVTYTYI
jgi:hypothetical protein